MTTKLLHLGVCFLLLSYGRAALADVAVMDKLQLQFALKSTPPCCVLDGRREANRQKYPLAEALPYEKGIKINPTASVVVIADNDRLAREIAAAVAKDYPGKQIIAVKGGVRVWEASVAALAKAAGGAPSSFNFVIPKNTCEQGTPLQQLRSNATK